MHRIHAAFLCGLVALTTANAQDGSSTAGHARARHLAEMRRLPTRTDVVIEDIVNYHRHALPMPRAGEAVALDVRFGMERARPGGHAVLQVGIATPRVADRGHLPPLNLALVIDCSGSMNERGKMERVKEALARFFRELRPEDRVAIVTYETEARVAFASRELGSGDALREVVASLRAAGSTNLHGGLMLGYRELARSYRPEWTNRVVLLTDGIANVGVTDPGEILRESLRYNEEGIDLSTIGVGDDLNGDLLARLSKGGRGLYHFVADERDIHKVFVAEVQSLIAPIAREVTLELEASAGARIARVFGYRHERIGDRMTFPLDDLNYGLTQVVLCEIDCPYEARELEVHARLTYRVEGEARRTVRGDVARLRLTHDAREHAITDHEVRKNDTIARLAAAMADMARHCEEKRWAEADQVLQRALALCRERFPTNDDPDLARVRKMAENYARTLSEHIERFRDL